MYMCFVIYHQNPLRGLDIFQLPTTCWDHAVLHAADLIQLRPTAYHTNYTLELVRGNPPSISHLRKFGCATYVPISPPQRTFMDPHRKIGIYVGYQSPSIIKYLEPRLGTLIVFLMRTVSRH
jgi:hypothetical protein